MEVNSLKQTPSEIGERMFKKYPVDISELVTARQIPSKDLKGTYAIRCWLKDITTEISLKDIMSRIDVLTDKHRNVIGKPFTPVARLILAEISNELLMTVNNTETDIVVGTIILNPVRSVDQQFPYLVVDTNS